MPATIEIVEFRFGDGIVDVDRWNQQTAFLMHLVKAPDAGGGLFRYATPILHDLVPAIRILALNIEQQIFYDLFFLVCRVRLSPIAAFFQFVAFVDEQRGVAAIVDHQLRTSAFGVRNRAIRAPPVFLERFALPCEHGDTAPGDGGSGMILRGENIAACPAHTRAKIGQCLDQDRCLNRHVQRSGDAHACQRFVRRVFFADRHQPRHFLFRNGNFSSAKIGQ